MITYSDQICCRYASPKCSLVRSSSIPVAKFFQSAKSGKIVPKEAAIMESIWHKSTDDLPSSSVGGMFETLFLLNYNKTENPSKDVLGKTDKRLD